MRRNLRFDIDCDNFDLYFANEVETISSQAKESLPKELQFKIFRKGGIYNATSSNKLPFLAKLFTLVRALRKRWILIVEDDKRGLTAEQFFALKGNLDKKDSGFDNANELKSTGSFVLGSTQLIDAFARLNNLSISPAYNYLVKGKNTDISETVEFSKQMNYVFKMICFYESQKRRWVMNLGLSVPEFYVLIFIYHGKETVSSQIHKEIYKYAYNSSSTQIKLAFGTLQKKGYIEKIGYKKGTSIRITEMGKDILNQIASKYIIDF